MDGMARYRVEIMDKDGHIASSPETALRNFLYAVQHETVTAKVTECAPGNTSGHTYILLEVKAGQVVPDSGNKK